MKFIELDSIKERSAYTTKWDYVKKANKNLISEGDLFYETKRVSP